MSNANSYIDMAKKADPLREPMLRRAIQALELPSGSQGLDAGCGIGLQSMLLAEAVGPAGHVTGLDISDEFLLHAKEIVGHSALSERIAFRQGDVHKLLFDNDTFDWVWSVDCVGYPYEDNPVPVLKELARVVKPGGTLAILAWSSQMLLPGYPLLEARLNATSSSYIPYVTGKKPESNFLRALGWFREAGLDEPGIRTIVDEVHAPLGDDTRTALVAFFEMLWGEPQPEASREDRAEYRRLCKPDSPDFILDCPDYYAFYTYSMFHGKIPE